MLNQMFPTKFLMIVTILLSLSNFGYRASGDGDVTESPITCLNCSKCEYPCQQQPSLPPPPPPSPPPYGYSIYGAPPPPPKKKDPSKCPPDAAAGGVECCTPPAPYVFAPPYPYTPVPYGEAQPSPSMLLHVVVPVMMLFSSFVFLF